MPNWTPEQRTAIETRGCELLVSAGAGTGKTAVLVERIVRLVLDGDSPVDLDRFLVVTFTEAAASEMREKIGEALRKRALEAGGGDRAERQVLLLDKAQISTLHSFCSALIRRHFHRLGLDPEFSVLDGEEAALIRAEVAERLFQKEFERAEGRFLHWLDGFGGANPENEARKRILQLHYFLRALDDAPGWSAGVRESYPLAADGKGALLDFEAHAWFKDWKDEFATALANLTTRSNRLLAKTPEDESKIRDWIVLFRTALEDSKRAGESGNWTAAIETLHGLDLPAVPRKSPKKDSEKVLGLKEALRSLKESFQKDLLGDLIETSPDEARRAHAGAAPEVHLLLDLAERFERAYSRAKRERTALDFNDLEQFCLQLLRDEKREEGQDEEGGEGKESAEAFDIAALCRDQFEVVLVDEYQDINPLQETILRKVSRVDDPERPNNFFAVGDVKQSIYEFRLAAPDIFLDKYNAYPQVEIPTAEPALGVPRNAESALGAPSARVDLRTNFRSRSGVLAGVNFLFERIMTRERSGLDYDRSVYLEPGALFPPPGLGEEDPLPVEVHLMEKESPEDKGSEPSAESDRASEHWDAHEREAFLVGRRILEMVGEPLEGVRLDGSSDAEAAGATLVFDRALPGAESGAESAMRPAAFRDIVVLLRSVKGTATAYVSVFNRMGIPAFADLGTGFFSADEVRDIMNLLRLIDNPFQDIPLASVLRSPLEKWTETELAELRALHPDGFFHEAPRHAASEDAPETKVGAKVREFLQRLDHWRTRARRGSLGDLITAIYSQTQYPAYVQGLREGARRRANLQRLQDLASEFDTFSRQGLRRFLRFIDQLRREEGDFGAATTLGESQNVVRIMSIHKSKGLEFPIVFLPNQAKSFNLSDGRSAMALSRSEGMALLVTDREHGIQYLAPALRLLRRSKIRKNIAEETRILYVAMTRARERLVLTGSVKNIETKLEDWLESPSTPGGNNTGGKEAGNSLDWIGPALASHGEARGVMIGMTGSSGVTGILDLSTSSRFDLRLHSAEKVAKWPWDKLSAHAILEEPALESAPSEQSSAEQADHAWDRAIWTYPHGALTRHPARIAVGEYKRRLQAANESGERSASALRSFEGFDLTSLLDEKKLRADGAKAASSAASPPTPSAADRGVWTHLVLQHLDLLRPLDYAGISSQIDALIERNLLSEEQRKAIDLAAIERFFASSLGQRLLALPVDRVWREVPFLLGLTPSEAGMEELAAYDEGERIRVQGVIDCVLDEEDGLVLIDYKTDKITAEAIESRTAHYRPQMALYAQAAAAIFPKPLKEKYLFFLELGRAEEL